MSILSITKTLFKSIMHGPYTTLYPIKKRDDFKLTRGSIDIDIAACIFCSICQRRCPTEAIEVQKANATWGISRLKCIQCGYCVSVCPKKCLSMNSQYTAPTTGKEKEVFENARISDHQEDHCDCREICK